MLPQFYKSDNYNLSLFGQRLGNLIAERELDVPRFCQQINISTSTIYLYLRREKLPGAEIAAKLADFFDVSVDWLLGYGNWEDK